MRPSFSYPVLVVLITFLNVLVVCAHKPVQDDNSAVPQDLATGDSFSSEVHNQVRRNIFSQDFWRKLLGRSSTVLDGITKASPVEKDGDWDYFWNVPTFQPAIADNSGESFLGEVAGIIDNGPAYSDVGPTANANNPVDGSIQVPNGQDMSFQHKQLVMEDSTGSPTLDVSNLKSRVKEVFQLPKEFQIEINITPPSRDRQRKVTYSLTEPFGTFSSPGFPLTYTVGTNYTWNINVTEGKDIQLWFFDFAVGNRNAKGCLDSPDYVVVTANSVANERWLFCGREARPITTRGNMATVKLVSSRRQDLSNSMGFFAAYIELPIPSTLDILAIQEGVSVTEREQASTISHVTTTDLYLHDELETDTPFPGPRGDIAKSIGRIAAEDTSSTSQPEVGVDVAETTTESVAGTDPGVYGGMTTEMTGDSESGNKGSNTARTVERSTNAVEVAPTTKNFLEMSASKNHTTSNDTLPAEIQVKIGNFDSVTGSTQAGLPAASATGHIHTVQYKPTAPITGPTQASPSASSTTGPIQTSQFSVSATSSTMMGTASATDPTHLHSSGASAMDPAWISSSTTSATDPVWNSSSTTSATNPVWNSSSTTSATNPVWNSSSTTSATNPVWNSSSTTSAANPVWNSSSTTSAANPVWNSSSTTSATNPVWNSSSTTSATNPVWNSSSAVPATDPAQISLSTASATIPIQNSSLAVSATGTLQTSPPPVVPAGLMLTTLPQVLPETTAEPTGSPAQNRTSPGPTGSTPNTTHRGSRASTFLTTILTGFAVNSTASNASSITASTGYTVVSQFPGEVKGLDADDGDVTPVPTNPHMASTSKHTSLSPTIVMVLDIDPKKENTEFAPGGGRLYTLMFDLTLPDPAAVYGDVNARETVLKSIVGLMDNSLKNSSLKGDYKDIHGLRLIGKGNGDATFETVVVMMPSSTVSMEAIQDIMAGALLTTEWNSTAASTFSVKYASVKSTDLDECSLGWHTCHKYANCVNTEGSYTCLCKKGYIMSSATEQICVETEESSTRDLWKKVTLIVSPIAAILLVCVVLLVVCMTRKRHYHYKEAYTMSGRITPGDHGYPDSQTRSKLSKEYRHERNLGEDTVAFTRV